MRAGFITDLTGVQFEEGTNTSWVHAMGIGEYQHPLYGKINLTADRIKAFADSVVKKVRGIDLDIDYDHKAKDTGAAGWVKQAEARDDGLWLLVEWTEEAAAKIKNKVFRYFSPEFHDEWQDSQGKKHKDVLFGGGITNRPFLKDLVPINFSEAFDVTERPSKTDTQEGTGMDPKKLRTQLGLPEDATDEQVDAKITELNARPEKVEEEEEVVAPQAIAASELVKTLSESTDPEKKALGELLASQQNVIATQGAALHLSEVNASVKTLCELARTKGYAVTPAQEQAWTNALLPLHDKQLSEKVFDAFKAGFETQLVQLTELGGAGNGNTDEKTATVKFNEAVAEFQKNNDKVDYADAVQTVAAQQPQLFAEYRDESTAFRI
jgi:phage I-like protein